MSQYNKTILTNAGLELAKRANAGQAKFEITRAVTSADDWSNKTIQDLEEVTAIPNIMQQGTVMDTEEVESNNSVIGVSLCFANKNLSTGYQIRIIGLYVKEEGQENDFLYAVTTAVTPEYMPDFNDKVLYRFNMQMYLVIGKAQAVNVVINDGASVTHGQFDKYKSEVTADLEKIENTHKEDMSHVVKSASINDGDEILPDEAGKLELVVPDPDLSKYVSLEQLTEALKTKADVTAIPDKTATEEGIRQAKQMAQEADTKAQSALDTKADKTTVEENLATKVNQSDLDQTNAEVAKKANSADVYTKTEVDSKTSGTIITDYDIASKTPTKRTDRYNNKWLVDQQVLGQFADQINQLKGRRTVDAPDFNTLTDTGVYMITNPSNGKNFPTANWGPLAVFNGNDQETIQLYIADDGVSAFVRIYGHINGLKWEWGSWNQIAWKSDIDTAMGQSYFRKQGMDENGALIDIHANATKQSNGGYAFDMYPTDWTATKLRDARNDIANLQNAINDINGTWNRYTHDDGFDLLTLWGKFGIHYCHNSNTTNAPEWFGDKRGTAFVFTFDNNSQTMIYASCTWYGLAYCNKLEGKWHRLATDTDITDLQNQIQQLKDNQFEVQTFTDATAAANWEAQRPGKRMAIVNK